MVVDPLDPKGSSWLKTVREVRPRGVIRVNELWRLQYEAPKKEKRKVSRRRV